MSEKLRWNALIALVTGMSLGNVGGNVMPELLDGFAENYKLSLSEAGIVAALQLLATAIAAIGLSKVASRPGRIRLARIGLVISAIGFAWAFFAPDISLLIAANIFAGLGLGAVFAAGTAALSSTPNVDKATTLAVFFSTITMAVLILSIPLVNDLLGGNGGFALLAAVSLLGILLVQKLPELPLSYDQSTAPALNWLFLAAIVMIGITEQGLWSYAKFFGRDYAGLSDDTVTIVLSVAALAALLGVLLGDFSRKMLGSASALIFVFSIGAIMKFFVAWPLSDIGFIVVTVIWQICYLAVIVLILAVAGNIDPSGRWVAASAGALALGTGIGPAVIGFVLETWGNLSLAIATACCVFVAAIPVIRAAMKVRLRAGD